MPMGMTLCKPLLSNKVRPCIFISAWGLRLLVLIVMGNSQEPQMVERVTDTVSTSFPFMSVIQNLKPYKAESGDKEATIMYYEKIIYSVLYVINDYHADSSRNLQNNPSRRNIYN